MNTDHGAICSSLQRAAQAVRLVRRAVRYPFPPPAEEAPSNAVLAAVSFFWSSVWPPLTRILEMENVVKSKCQNTPLSPSIPDGSDAGRLAERRGKQMARFL